MSIPLVQNNEKDSINTSIIAIKRNIERINMLLGLSNSEEIDTSKFATKDELQQAVTDLQPVDEVAVDNMHAVTSNAVAESQKWKDLNGNSIVGLDYNELAISAWIISSGTTNEIIFSQQYARGMLSLTQTPQILILGGYYISSNDYGLCNLNNNRGVITIRNFYYAGENYTSSADIKIRYR